MPINYTKDQLWQLYQKLPDELKEAVSSLENTDNIYNICEINNIPEGIMPSVIKYVGYVLIGVLPPNEFQKTLEEELKISAETAQKVAREIHRFIFYPVKAALEELYKIEITSVPTPVKPLGVAPSAPEKYRETSEGTEEEREALKSEVEELAAAGEKKEEPRKEDEYREPVE